MTNTAETTIIGIDVGDKRVGVALGTVSPRVAVPHAVFQRARGEAERRLIDLARERNAALLVVGLPLDAQGGRTPQCDKVESFCRRIERRLALEIVFVDEHLSSEEARSRLDLGARGEREARQAGRIDAVAAAMILQEYLDNLP